MPSGYYKRINDSDFKTSCIHSSENFYSPIKKDMSPHVFFLGIIFTVKWV